MALEKGSAQGRRSSRWRRSAIGSVFLAIATSFLAVVYLVLKGNSRPSSQIQQSFDKYYALSQDCFAAPADPSDRRKNKGVLKVVNFNCEWLFLYGGMGGIRCPADSCPWTTFEAALRHLADVADLLVKIDADIVHLSEVEDCRVLRALLEAMPKDHGYRPYLIHGKDHMTGQNVGLLTRIDPKHDIIRTEKRGHYPVEGSQCRRKPGTIGVTKHYVAAIDVDNGRGKTIPFVFTGIHLLARPANRFRCAQREGQASVLRDLVRSMSLDGQRVVIMGDFNDYDDEAPGADGRRSLTKVLQILRESSGSGRSISNAAKLVPRRQRYSCWFDMNQNCRVDGTNELVFIDHILYDADLDVLESKVHHDLVPLPSCESRISDHWPFSVTFRL